MEMELEKEVNYWACFKTTNRRQTWIVIFANVMPAMFGLNVLANSSYFMQTIGMKAKTSLILMIIGVVLGILANATSSWFMSLFGRRPLTITTLLVDALLWSGMGISGFFTGKIALWWAAVSMSVVTVICGLGCWPTGYAIMGETSSLRLRAKSQAIGGVAQQVSSAFMTYTSPYIFNPDAGNSGAKIGFYFTGLSVMAAAITFLYVPETKGRTTLELDQMFHEKLPTRAFKSWQSPGLARKIDEET